MSEQKSSANDASLDIPVRKIPAAFVSKESDLFLADYNASRTDLSQFMSTRYQIMILALTALGLVIGALAFAGGIFLVLLYPVFTFFLLNVYISNEFRIKVMNRYMRALDREVEETLEDSGIDLRLGFYRFYHEVSSERKGLVVGGKYIFPVAATVAILAAIPFVILGKLSPSLIIRSTFFFVNAALFSVLTWVFSFRHLSITEVLATDFVHGDANISHFKAELVTMV
jgi:hypothetical protein